MTDPATSATFAGAIAAGPFELSYLVEGVGHPAIVIGSARYYPRVFSGDLRNHLRLVFVDHRGFAPSPGPVDLAEFALDKLVDDVEALRRHLGLPRVAVIGHSGHAFMALEYAKTYPEHTSHLVMIGVAPDLSPASARLADGNYRLLADAHRLEAEQANTRALPDDELATLTGDRAFILGYIRNAARIWFDPMFDCASLWDGVTINMDMFNHVWGKLFAEIDVTQGLDQFDRPVFLALGRYDFIVAPPASWDPITPKFKDLTIRIFERSGHTPQLEEPELFDAELLRWMDSRR